MLLISDLAQYDVEQHAKYIAQRNPIRSKEWIKKVREQFKYISTIPSVGKPQYNLGVGVKSLAFGNYIIFFQEIESGVEILRMIHGAQNFKIDDF